MQIRVPHVMSSERTTCKEHSRGELVSVPCRHVDSNTRMFCRMFLFSQSSMTYAFRISRLLPTVIPHLEHSKTHSRRIKITGTSPPTTAAFLRDPSRNRRFSYLVFERIVKYQRSAFDPRNNVCTDPHLAHEAVLGRSFQILLWNKEREMAAETDVRGPVVGTNR